ncbi:MAG: 30S ribosomal protein S17 [Candidatus Omnitrophica bacterium]|nr:30S ribosomal protein S17 [Candidatus Omnitrophota bacterium]
MTTRTNRRKTVSGKVVSDKMNKTRVVQVFWTSQHSDYLKTTPRAVKYKAHDEKNEARMGDTVKIMETRPLSKDKRWVILEVLQKARTKIQEGAQTI